MKFHSSTAMETTKPCTIDCCADKI